MTRPERDGELVMSGRERAEHGATLTFENDAGKRLSLSRVGPVAEAIRAACDDALRLDDTFQVICISTPSSIYADIKVREGKQFDHTVQRPEGSMLRRAGRGSMLHPGMVGGSRHAQMNNIEQNRNEAA